MTAPSRRSVMRRLGLAAALGVGGSAVFERAAAAGGPTAVTAFNVRDYGATGDGTTDDVAAIQAAIDAAAEDGGLVFLPPGTYALGTSIVLRPRVHLLGSGENATVVTLRAGVERPVLVSPPGVTVWGFSLRALTIDGNKAHNSGG